MSEIRVNPSRLRCISMLACSVFLGSLARLEKRPLILKQVNEIVQVEMIRAIRVVIEREKP